MKHDPTSECKINIQRKPGNIIELEWKEYNKNQPTEQKGS